MSQDTNTIRKERNRERQRRFWASMSAEERRRTRLRYALNSVLKLQEVKKVDA